MRQKAVAEKKIQLRSTIRQIYGGILLMPGDEFPEPLAEHIALPLIKGHFASDSKDDIDVQRPKRRYRRRDMRSEG